MAIYTAAHDRDANRHVISSNEAFLARKNVAFDGSAGNGAVGTVNLFTVTGDVLVILFATCAEDLAGASATVAAGISGNTGALITSSTATTINNGESWTDATPTTVEALVTSPRILTGGADIILTVGTANVTDGTLNFYCQWRPLSIDGNVVAA